MSVSDFLSVIGMVATNRNQMGKGIISTILMNNSVLCWQELFMFYFVLEVQGHAWRHMSLLSRTTRSVYLVTISQEEPVKMGV